MGSIRASCFECGDVVVTSNDITVFVHTAEPLGSYVFQCPCCNTIVKKDAEPRIVELLVISGVKLTILKPAEELDESRDLLLDGRPPIDHDDLIDFHDMMSTIDSPADLDPELFADRTDVVDSPNDIKNV